MDCFLPGFSVYGNFQGIFLIQESIPCLLHWQVDSSLLSHQGSLSEVRQSQKDKYYVVLLH